MKNFKIAMILVAAVAFFCSCGDPEAPVVSLSDATSMNEMTFDLANPEAVVNIGGAISDEKGISTLNVTKTMYDADNKVVGTVVPYTFDAPYEGETTYAFSILDTLKNADVKDAAKVVYEAVVTNKKGGEATATYTVTIKPASFTTANFTWTRSGNSDPDLSAFGLDWTRNNEKTIYADIRPLNANAKLYELAATDYAATSVADITFPAPIEKYKKILADATGVTNYDNVIASVYEGKTYVFHITKGTSSYDATTGTTLVIEGEYKTFEATPAAK